MTRSDIVDGVPNLLNVSFGGTIGTDEDQLRVTYRLDVNRPIPVIHSLVVTAQVRALVGSP